MGKVLLTSLVSDQTLPNVQLIKEFASKVTDYLFITTKTMELQGNRKWILNSSSIQELENVSTIEVDQLSFEEIEQKLKHHDFEIYDKIIVNLTGGTKVMTLAAFNFFKNRLSEIYYVTGNNEKYIKVHPIKTNNISTFSFKISLAEYLKAYGFEFKEPSKSAISFEQTKKVYDSFCKININEHLDSIKFIHEKRSKKINSVDFQKIKPYLDALHYPPMNENSLSKVETSYLSGDWFEQYIGQMIKHELDLSDDEIFIGTTIRKEISLKKGNSMHELLGIDETSKDSDNEMDVMFVYKNEFYSIECKTSIIAFKNEQKDGVMIEKPYNILGETLYKSDSLKTRFGLFAKTSIVTLSDFKEYCNDEDREKRKNKTKAMEGLINRANLSRIKLIDKDMLCNSKSIYNLIK